MNFLGTKPKPAAKPEERQDMPWVEKYRPKSISQVAAQDEVVQVLRSSLETKNLPHLLFYGPPGTGKTSTILAFTRDFYQNIEGKVLELNASDERGISVIREKVKQFAKSSTSAAYKIIILDEADSMTTDAQAALRRIMEKYARVTRFCLVCNYVSRIIEPLASRCTKFRFKSLPRQQAIGRVMEVAQLEKVPCSDQQAVVETLVDCAQGDLRRAIMSLQSASRMVANNKDSAVLTPQMVSEMVGIVPGPVVKDLRSAWDTKDIEKLKGMVDDVVYAGYPVTQVLGQLHDLAMVDEQLSSLQKAKLARLMSSVDKALCDGADEQLQLLDLMLQASRRI